MLYRLLRDRILYALAWVFLALSVTATHGQSSENSNHYGEIEASNVYLSYTASGHNSALWGLVPIRDAGCGHEQRCVQVSPGSQIFTDTIIDVDTAAGLNTALQQAVGGEVLSLSAGDYGALPELFIPSIPFSEPVVLIAADTSAPPVLGGLTLTEGRQLSFDGLDWSVSQGGMRLDLVPDATGFLGPQEAPLLVLGPEMAVPPAVQNVALTETEITVSDSAELGAALETAQDGTTIRLLEGSYGDLDLSAYHRDVRLLADPGTQAVFDKMKLQNVSGLTLDGLTFKLTFAQGMEGTVTRFSVDDSANLTIRNSLFEGDLAFGTDSLADGNGAGRGLRIRTSEDITLDGNEFKGFWKGLQISNSNDIGVIGNELHQMRSDAMTLSQVQNMLIEGNYLHDRQLAEGSEDHADLIQMMSKNAETPSSNVIIRGNLFDIGDGDKSQSLFLSNRAVANGAGEEMFYSDFLIEDNVILNGQVNALYLGAIDGLVVRNNTVLHATPAGGGTSSVPVIRVAQESHNVVIEQNVTGGLRGYKGQEDWQVSGNVIVQNTDPTAADHYTDHFIAPTGQLGGHVEKLQLRPDSSILDQGAGASMLRGGTPPLEMLTPLILPEAQQNRAQYLFDARLGPTAEDVFNGDTLQFDWAFSDGVQVSGRQIARQFSEPGIYTVELTMTAPDGRKVVTDSVVEVAGGDLVGMDADTGALMVWAYGSNEVLYDPGAPPAGIQAPVQFAAASAPGLFSLQASSAPLSMDSQSTQVVDLLAPGTPVILPRDSFAPIFETGHFEITMHLTGGGDGSTGGTLLELRGALLVEVNASGEVVLSLTSEDGTQAQVQSSGAGLNDAGISRDVGLFYDDAKNIISLTIDGVQQDSAWISGPMALAAGRDMNLGGSYDGKMSDFQLRADPDSYDYGLEITADAPFPYPEFMDDPRPLILAGDEGDVLRADASGALLLGGAGNDRLRESASDDVMVGGGGADNFVFDLRRNSGPEHDMIMDLDFESGDRLRILTRHEGLFSEDSDSDNALRITASGASVSIDSLEDLREVVLSGALTATDSDQGVLLSLSALPDHVLQLASIETGDFLL